MTFSPDPTTGDIEAGVGKWEPVFGPIDSSSLRAHAGTRSLRILSTGGDTYVQARTPTPPDVDSLTSVGAPTSVVIDGWAFTADSIFESFQMVWQFFKSDGTPSGSTSILEPVVVGSWVHLIGIPIAIDTTDVYLHGVLTTLTTGGGGAMTAGGEAVFWDDFHYTYGAGLPVRKRQLRSREFTIRRGPQGHP